MAPAANATATAKRKEPPTQIPPSRAVATEVATAKRKEPPLPAPMPQVPPSRAPPMPPAKRKGAPPPAPMGAPAKQKGTPPLTGRALTASTKRGSEIMKEVVDPAEVDALRKQKNGADVSWYLCFSSHHITGNLNVLTDLTFVPERWIKLPERNMQVCGQGSVNHRGMFLDDVWYVPACPLNVLSIAQLRSQGLQVHEDGDSCFVERIDGTVVGQGRYLRAGAFPKLDFLNISSANAWYIALDAAEHMTGDMNLLVDFTPMSPGRPVQTRTGMLQVRGKGSVKNTQFIIPDVSYVPEFKENIVALTQLTGSGFTVAFGPCGACTITRSSDGVEVGRATHVGGQLFRLNYLRVSPSGSLQREVSDAFSVN